MLTHVHTTPISLKAAFRHLGERRQRFSGSLIILKEDNRNFNQPEAAFRHLGERRQRFSGSLIILKEDNRNFNQPEAAFRHLGMRFTYLYRNLSFYR